MSNMVVLLLAATVMWTYIVDLLCTRFRMPAVIPLVVTGLVANGLLQSAGINVRWVDRVLPVLGTAGLVLIVLEGALDIRLSRDRRGMILRSLAAALIGVVLCTVVFAGLMMVLLDLSSFVAITIAIPFAVISSAVAIPSSRVLSPAGREFIVYESSMSDIIGVLVFFAWLPSAGDPTTFVIGLFGGGALSLLVCLFLSAALFMLANHIRGHVRFIPMLAALFLLYALGKHFHLSTLLLILFFGLMLNNAAIFRRIPQVDKWMVENYEASVDEFKGIVAEVTFAVRGVFFVLLGVWTPLAALTDWRAWVAAALATALIFALRKVTLSLLRVEQRDALLWVAPRGLITVLLVLSAADEMSLAPFPAGAVMLTVLMTCSVVLRARSDVVESKAPEQAVA